MKKVLLALAVVAAGCGQPFWKPTPVAGRGVVYVYRPYKWVANMVMPGATLSDQAGQVIRSFRVRTAKYVATEVPAGNVMFTGVSMDGRPQMIPLGVPDGGAAYVRCELMWGGQFVCQPVPPDVGEIEASKLRRNIPGD